MTYFFIAACCLIALFLLNRAASFFPSFLQKTIRWFHAFAFEWLIILFDVVLRPLAYRRSNPSGLKTGRPILLVHGYFHNSAVWFLFQRRLARKGLGPIYTLNLRRPLASIQEHAKSVEAMAQKIEEETGRKDLALIGHSMGGLVNAWYASRLAPKEKAMDLVTIGSPLGGTYTAYLGLGLSAREMKPGSPLIRHIQELVQNPKTRLFCAATKTDALIIPYSSALAGQEKERHFVVEDMGHLSLVYSSRVATQVAKWLSS